MFFKDIFRKFELMYKVASWLSSLMSNELPPSFMITVTANWEPPAPRIYSRCCLADILNWTGPNSPNALPVKSGSRGSASTLMMQPKSFAES